MSIKRSNSKQLQDYPGYSGNFSSVHSIADSDMDVKYKRNWEPPADYQESLDLDKKWPGDIKYQSDYRHRASTTVSSDHYDTEGNPKTMKRVLVRFAERTSMQGVPYINVSKTWYAKLMWTLLFFGALVGMVVHLYVLCTSYLAFSKQTKIQLGFDNIKFPTVTICNVNPVRSSKLDSVNKDLREFIRSIRPERVATSLKKKPNSPAPVPPLPPGSTSPPPPPPGRRKRFIDDLEFNFTNTRQELENSKPRRPHGRRSNIHEIKSEFNYLFSTHDRATRISLGHELDDMLVSCTFSGYVCNASHFRVHPTSTFGNCYTLENADYISYKSGPTDGLELILFLETDEYIPTIASGTGAQIQIQDTNTWPYPEVEGMAMSASMETSIAMRMVKIERLNWPNNDCEYGTEFEAKYGLKYTRQECQLICLQERVVSKCGCYDEEKHELQSNINTDVKGGRIPACRNRKDVECMLSVEEDWETGEFICPCKNPCYETTYQKLVTSRLWPSDAYAKILVQHLCNSRNESECEKYETMDPRLLSQNFMKINIFFDDLNYELISEARDYEDVQFASDVGGTVGLWVGLSVLSLAEVIQFFTEIFHFLLCVKPRRRKAQNHRNDVTRNNTQWEIRSGADQVTYSPRFHERNKH